MLLFCQPGNAEHLSIWLKGPLEGCSTVAASLSGTELPLVPSQLLSWPPPWNTVPTQPLDLFVPVVQQPCDPVMWLLWAPKQQVPPSAFWEHPGVCSSWSRRRTKTLLNCVCRQCLVGNCRCGFWDRYWGWVGATHRASCCTLRLCQSCRAGGEGRMLRMHFVSVWGTSEHDVSPFLLRCIYLILTLLQVLWIFYPINISVGWIISCCFAATCCPCLDAQGRRWEGPRTDPPSPADPTP